MKVTVDIVQDFGLEKMCVQYESKQSLDEQLWL